MWLDDSTTVTSLSLDNRLAMHDPEIPEPTTSACILTPSSNCIYKFK